MKPEKLPVQKHALKRYTAKDLQSKDFKMPPPPSGLLQWRCKRCRKRAEGVPYSGPPHDGKYGCILGPREPPSLPEGNPTGERRATRTKVKGRNASSPSVRPSTRIKDWWENIRSDQCGKHDPDKEASDKEAR